MLKVVFIEPVLAHYRKDVFEYLQNNEDFNISILGGKNYQGILEIGSNNHDKLNYSQLRFLGRNFYYLKGTFKYLRKSNCDAIVCSGVDFHLIHTILIFVYYQLIKRVPFYWWSHATFGKQGSLGKWIRKKVYSNSSGVLSYSQQGKQNLLHLGLQDDHIMVVNNALNLEDYGFIKYSPGELSSTNKTFTILFCGRITKSKKLDLLIKALHEIMINEQTQIQCQIIGGGSTEEYQKMLENFGLTGSISFLGAKYGVDKDAYFLNVDLFVYPGGIGLSILQALSFGLPVITTDNLQLHGPEIELLQPGINGDFFADDNVSSLVNKILFWKNRIGSQKAQVVTSCINSVKEKNYLPESVGKAIIG